MSAGISWRSSGSISIWFEEELQMEMCCDVRNCENIAKVELAHS
jgi:hypothetical protein